MTTIQVRLGKQFTQIDGHFDKWVRMFLSTLRLEVFSARIAAPLSAIEMEVHHDQHGWDVNVAPIKITVITDLSERSRTCCYHWLKELHTSINSSLQAICPANEYVDRFQVCLVLGGHQIGTVREFVEGEVSNCMSEWCDEELKRK